MTIVHTVSRKRVRQCLHLFDYNIALMPRRRGQRQQPARLGLIFLVLICNNCWWLDVQCMTELLKVFSELLFASPLQFKEKASHLEIPVCRVLVHVALF